MCQLYFHNCVHVLAGIFSDS